MSIYTKLFLINLMLVLFLIVTELILNKGDVKKRLFGVWINVYANLTFVSIPVYFAYLIATAGT